MSEALRNQIKIKQMEMDVNKNDVFRCGLLRKEVSNLKGKLRRLENV